MRVLLFLESLGTTELLVILLVALVLFGPRKLPEMTRKFGKSLNEFKRASDDFKRTWEREVAMESVEREAAIDRALVAEPQTENFATEANIGGTRESASRDITEAAVAPVQGANVARGSHFETPADVAAVNADEPETTAAEQSSRKTDWL